MRAASGNQRTTGNRSATRRQRTVRLTVCLTCPCYVSDSGLLLETDSGKQQIKRNLDGKTQKKKIEGSISRFKHNHRNSISNTAKHWAMGSVMSKIKGGSVEIHNVLSWEFNSSLKVASPGRKTGTKLLIGLVTGFSVTFLVLGVFCFIWWQRRVKKKLDNEALDIWMDDEFEKGSGPRRFSYRELSQATKNFSEDEKLGEGGFGGVYKGFFSGLNLEVAVKRVSRGSKQGKKEYISEVKIISRIRHRNLVQLIGWCHEKGEFLLVYEFMPNGSLDFHLFKGKAFLPWEVRYKIALGLTSALLYLHEEWEQCVIHRDIKSSNIMLDSNFNVKLGDFGLARLVDHGSDSQTTVLAGTMGYLAPECVTTGKASKESDVYSFGVVCLEISCGRKPVDPSAEPSRIRLVEWVWDLYGKGQVLEKLQIKE